jgi:hypothetical protein|tara:strand:+ start:111 stop:305 length:195 start_codon:yes stop_codon:yes gene_type:complete
MKTDHETILYFLRKAVIFVEVCIDKNGDDDLILPLGANKVLLDVVEALEEEINRANDFEEYDPG